MSGVTGAIIAGGATIVGGAIASRGARSAADAQVAGSDAAIAEQRRQFDIIQQQSAPYLRAGTNALSRLDSMYGGSLQPTQQFSAVGQSANIPAMVRPGGGGPIGSAISRLGARGIPQQNGPVEGIRARSMHWAGDNMGQGPIDAGAGAFRAHSGPIGTQPLGPIMEGPASKLGQAGGDFFPGGKPQTPAAPSFTNGLNVPDYSAFFASPDYQFRRDEGLRGVEGSFAARGMGQSGNALRALTEFGSNLAAGEFGNYFNRQGVLAGVGQTANNMNAQAGMAAAGNIGNALMNAGNARASGIQGQYDAYGNALNGIGQGLGYWLSRRNG